MVVAAARAWRPAGAERDARLVVVGDADVASDGFIDFLSNRDFVENALRWLVDEDGRRVSTLDVTGKGSFALITGLAGVPGSRLRSNSTFRS